MMDELLAVANGSSRDPKTSHKRLIAARAPAFELPEIFQLEKSAKISVSRHHHSQTEPPLPSNCGTRLGRNNMSHIDYALYESPVGYALFKVIHQQDAVGLKLKETQAAGNDLAKFGKMVQLANFTPFRYDSFPV